MNHLSLRICLGLLGLLFSSSLAVAGEKTISFFFKIPTDIMLVSHSGHLNIEPVPEKFPLLPSYGKSKGLVLISRVRNAKGEVIGFASELEDHPQGGEPGMKTVWTVTIPGEGSLIGYQIETRSPAVGKAFGDAAKSETGWSGNLTFQSTSGPQADKSGIIIGGTGKYKNIRGKFFEFDTFQAISATGKLTAEIELRFIVED